MIPPGTFGRVEVAHHDRYCPFMPMRILLIYPYCLEERGKDYDVRPVPIGVYYIGALLREHGYEVEILNWYDINKTPQKIKKVLSEKRPDIIGLSVLQANRWGALEVARAAKKINPDVKVVYGGVAATFLWRHFLTHFEEIDFTVLGEGEYTFLELVRCLERNDIDSLESIKGIAFRKDGQPFKTADPSPIEDIDKLPVPSKYFDYQHVVSARGCPWNCIFCGSPQFWGRKVRFHSADYFVNQLECLYKRGVNFFYVSDDTFTLKKDRVIEICRQIIRRGLRITWQAISRVDCVDEEILYWMRLAGCIQISYGVESGSKKMRDFFNKKIDEATIKKAFRLTRSYGILARAYFIYGSPGESWKTIQESIDFIHEIRPLSVVFYILDIYPGTALYSDFKRRKKVTDDIWLKKIEDIMYHETDPGLPADQVLAFGKKMRTDYYSNLHRFTEDLDLVDRKELYKAHADFCTRLAMTFQYGDYARNDNVRHKEKVAERLFRKALTYYPDHHAYLGLGIIYQKRKLFEESIKLLTDGTRHYPESQQLNMCLGVSYMNIGDLKKALSCFLPFQNSPDALMRAAHCYEVLGDSENMTACMRRVQRLKQGQDG